MADVGEALLNAYVGLAGLAAPVGRVVLRSRLKAGKEDPSRWRERLGVSGPTTPAVAPVIWIHAASVGEAVAVRPLVERIAAQGFEIVMTTVTVTSAAVVSRWQSPRVHHRFAPMDLPGVVDAFLDAWRPRLALFVESEIWPVTIARLAGRGIPLVIANGRMSERSFRGWSRFPIVGRTLFGRIGLCLAQSDGDAERFRSLGATNVVTTGNVKFDAAAPEAAPEVAGRLEEALAGRQVMLAASTHPGEDAQVLAAFETLRTRHPGLLLIVAPRHPERGRDVTDLAAGRGHQVRRRASGEAPDADAAVYVADTVGELGTFYRLATIAFVGGSLIPVGGHNPIEPARYGTPILTGPEVANFREVYDAFLAADAAEMVSDSDALAAAVERLLSDELHHRKRVAAADRILTRYTGALDRTYSAVAELLPPSTPGWRGGR